MYTGSIPVGASRDRARPALDARALGDHDRRQHAERRVENFDIFDFELTDADRERIDAL